MLQRRFSALLGAAALTLGLLSGCEESVTPDTNVTVPNAPTALMALSTGDSSVTIKWTASTSETSAKFTGYRIVVTEVGGASQAPQTVAKTAGSVAVNGLLPNKVYEFSIRSVTSDTVSTAAVIRWMGATRWTTFANSTTPIRLYETASSFASGMAITPNGPESRLSIQANTWDLCLDTRTPQGSTDPSFEIGSPGLSTYQNVDTARKTLIAFDTTRYRSVGTIDDVYESAPLNPTSQNLITFTNVTTGFVFAFKTPSGNYGRAFVVARNNKLLQDDAPNRYVELVISYNKNQDQPYALPSPANPGSLRLRKVAASQNDAPPANKQ